MMYPNSGHTVPTSKWTTADIQRSFCAARKYFAAAQAEKDLLNSKVTGGCPN